LSGTLPVRSESKVFSRSIGRTTRMATTYPVDIIAKTEQYDVDMMEALLRHEGVSKGMKAKLTKYKKRGTNGNKVVIQYGFSDEWIDLKVGRIQPKLDWLGLAVFPSEIRNALAQKYYWDMDIVNCQPVICSQLAKRFGLATPALDTYIEQREAIIETIMKTYSLTRKEVKDICIAVLFGGTRYEHPLLLEMKNELSSLSALTINECPKIFERANRTRKPGCNPVARAFSVYIQTIEEKILACINYFIKEERRELDTLIYDGGLLRKLSGELEPPQELLRKCEAFVEEQEGYKISLLYKPLQHSYVIPESSITYTSSDVVIDDSYAAKVFVSLMGDKLVHDISKMWWIFDDATGLWEEENEDVLKRYLQQYAKEMTFYQMTQLGTKIYNYAGKECNIQAMMKNIKTHLPDAIDFIESRADTGIGKFLFLDGIYTIDTQTFTTGFNPSILFFGRIPRKFGIRDEVLISKIHKILFEDPYTCEQTEQATLYKRGLARALYGNYKEHKNFYFTVGEANCGRGLLTGALGKAFGEYVTIFNGNVLLYNKNNSDDEAKKYAWLVGKSNTRLLIGNEVTMAPGKFMDGNSLKGLSSGGDAFEGRKNFKDGAKYVMRGIILLQANDMAPIKPVDEGLMNRCIVNELVKTYKEHPDPTNPKEMKQDMSLKGLFNTETYANALFYLMNDIYHQWIACGKPMEKPDSMKQTAHEWIETESSIKSILLAEYEITKNPEDFVTSRRIIEFLKERRCVESETKIGRELGKLGLTNIRKKLQGRTQVVWIGIRKIEENLED